MCMVHLKSVLRYVFNEDVTSGRLGRSQTLASAGREPHTVLAFKDLSGQGGKMDS